MSFKSRKTKKEKQGKALDDLNHQPEVQWYKGRLIPSKDVPLKETMR